MPAAVRPRSRADSEGSKSEAHRPSESADFFGVFRSFWVRQGSVRTVGGVNLLWAVMTQHAEHPAGDILVSSGSGCRERTFFPDFQASMRVWWKARNLYC